MAIFFTGCRGEIPVNNKINNILEPQEQVCYKFSKDDFNETLKIPEDIIVNIGALNEDNEAIGIKTTSLNKDKFFYYCDKNGDDSYKCSGLDSIESFQFQLRDGFAYFHADYLEMTSDSGAFLHRIKSKSSNFSKGVKTSCYKPLKPILEVKDIKKGSKKDKFLQSINIDDVIIYDIDYHKNFVVAVGEDNSPKTRAAQYTGYAYTSLIIKSTDGGKTWQRVKSEDMTYNEHVVVLDDKSAIVSSFSEDMGGAIEASFDAGEKWKTVVKHGDKFVSLKRVGNEIIASRESGVKLKSKDGGKNWEEMVFTKQNATKVLPKEDTLAVLQTPIYKVDYKTNNLIVRHSKGYTGCNSFALSLVYNKSNQKEGILGRYWSLGIESSITLHGSNELFYFDSGSGEEKLFIRNNIDKNRFYHNGSSFINQTKNGYTKECGKTKQYFDKKGYLTKIEFKKKSYVVRYKENKIVKIEEFRDGKYIPYISILDSYEGVVLTFHQIKCKKKITFLRNKDGLLSSVLDGNKYVFHYTYSEGKDRVLIQVDDNSKKYTDPTILLFEFSDFGEKKSTVYDSSRRDEGIIEEKSYLHYSKEKEDICFVDKVRKIVNNGVIKSVQNSTALYSFSYYDKEKKRLFRTQHEEQVYGFDKVGRLNFYANDDSNISIRYSDFHKALESLVYKNGKLSKYRYTYNNSEAHRVKTISSPKGFIEILYNKNNDIKEMTIDKYHFKYEYNKNRKPTKIISAGKGEIITFYDNKGEIENTKFVPLKNGITHQAMAVEFSKAMKLLLKRISAGSIKKYPAWLW